MGHRSQLTIVLLIAVTLVACVDIPDSVTAVKDFSPERYAGRWYEVVRSDNRFERGMDNVTAHYTLGDKGRITVHNQGYRVDKSRWDDITGKAYPVGDAGEARLKVSFFGPFYSGYNVIALDADYQHALVVGSDLSYV